MQDINLNFGWEFIFDPDENFFLGEERETESADIPHTYAETGLNYFSEKVYQRIGGYRKKINIPKDWEGKKLFLEIGAAAHRSEVFVNGFKVNEHFCGYTSYITDLTDNISFGEDNIIGIKVDSREEGVPPFGFVIDYMTYGGIFREIKLRLREKEYINDLFHMPDPSSGKVVTVISFSGGEKISQTIREKDSGKVVASVETDAREEFECKVENPILWDIDSPFLYTVTTRIIADGEVKDEREVNIGFRKALFKGDGFYLNDRKLKIIGLNRHQSFPYVGYAMPASMQRYDADILKNELGVNAVRTSHYPQSGHFIDRCDELGLLVFTEIPGWQFIGDESWKEQAVKNTADMVKQYRNHPSVILWGVRINESRDDDEFYLKTNETAHKLDPTRQTGGVRYLKKSSLLEDVYTYNDFLFDGKNAPCEKKRNVTSDMSKGYLVSEYSGHMFPSKPYDSEEHVIEHALRHATILDAIAGEGDIAGSFGWCMFDYNTHKDFGSGDRICYHGVCDMFRNKKLAADVYAVNGKENVLSISTNLDIGERKGGNRGRNFIFTNADKVVMYKNGNKVREYTHADSAFKNLKYPPIELDDYIGDTINEGNFTLKQGKYIKDVLNYSAIHGMSSFPPSITSKAAYLMVRHGMSFEDAYKLYGKYIGNWGDEALSYRFDAVKNGETVMSKTLGAFESATIKAEVSSAALSEDETYDVSSVRIRIVDQNGNTLRFWNSPVTFVTDGKIGLIGPSTVTPLGGMRGTYIRSKGESGEGKLTISSAGLDEVIINFRVEKKTN